MSETDSAFNLPLKCTPEEYKHFVEPAVAEANKSNFPAALDIVSGGLNAHPASEGLLFLKAYFGYKLADSLSNELSTLPKAMQPMGWGMVMVDGAATAMMLGRFAEIVRVLGEAGSAIEEFLQLNPKSQEVLAFKGYLEQKLQKLEQESENMRATFGNSPNIAGAFCEGCKKSISFDNQKVVFRRASSAHMEVWHLQCFPKQEKQN